LSEIRVLSSVATSKRDPEAAVQLAADGRIQTVIDTRYQIEVAVGTALWASRRSSTGGLRMPMAATIPPSTPIEAVMIIALRKPSESERAHGALGVPPRTKDA
jgi:hypothetical protein